MSTAPQPARSPITFPLAGVGLLLVAVVSFTPLLVEARPVRFVSPHSPATQWAGKAIILLAMLGALVVRARADRGSVAQPGRHLFILAVLAGLLTAWHWLLVDTRRGEAVVVEYDPDGPRVHRFQQPYVEEWQREQYLHILNRDSQPIPHVYRPLPYGFTRTLELLTGDWYFACVSYRWFFTFWFLWAFFRFVCLFHSPARAWLALAVYLVLYPCSIAFYFGQLTDPMSHALFALALIYVIQDRWRALLPALFLGVLAKETVIIMVPAYWACYWRQGRAALSKATALGLACGAAFLVARLPVGWEPSVGSMSNTPELMITTNLGIGPIHYLSRVPLYQNYLQPFLFTGPFLPWIALGWRRTDDRLKALFVVLTPLLLASSLCFGWLYESRNYVPLLPVLTTMALTFLPTKPRP